jgi:molybdopterin-guanine dinucleotide biosynthesis protein A
MQEKNTLYGLVMCGGNSSRMGIDKSIISYHGKPQRYHVFEMLNAFCAKTFISCNESQLSTIDKNYESLVDLPDYTSIGPMAALLTAFTHYPHSNFVVIGCDYPLLTDHEVEEFVNSLKQNKMAAAFYNKEQQLYEPLLAWYSHRAVGTLMRLFEKKEFSLQYFLRSVNAEEYYPEDPISMTSVDTPEGRVAVERCD